MNRDAGLRRTSSTSRSEAPPRSRITVAAARGTVLRRVRSAAVWRPCPGPSAGAATTTREAATARRSRAASLASGEVHVRILRVHLRPRNRRPGRRDPRRHRVRGHPRHVVLSRVRGPQARLRTLRRLSAPAGGARGDYEAGRSSAASRSRRRAAAPAQPAANATVMSAAGLEPSWCPGPCRSSPAGRHPGH